MWKKIKKSKEDTCPKCNSTDLEFEGNELNEGGVCYEFTCNKCGFYGQIWYDLVFDGIYEDIE